MLSDKPRENRRRRTLAGALLWLLMSALAGASQAGQLRPDIAALADDPAAASRFDYMDLKTRGLDLGALADAVYERSIGASGSGPSRCLTDAEVEVHASLTAAATVETRQAFEQDRANAHNALRKWRSYSDGVENGSAETPPGFSAASERFAAARGQADPRVRDLFLRAAEDQLIRSALQSGAHVWGELSPGAQARTATALNTQICRTDAANTAWLKSEVATNGWFLVSTAGNAASRAAWLLVQHADRDRAFQQQMLATLEPLLATGDVNRSDYAYLWDRVASGEMRAQRYGTQGRCTGRGVWTWDELESPERVDALRAMVGLGPLAEYASRMNEICVNATD